MLNVASIAAFQPVPTLATYAATKAFVLSLSESLSEELREFGITVTALCPGITATHMLAAATDANSSLAKLPGFLVGDAAKVADEGYRACMQGVAIKVPGAINQAVTLCFTRHAEGAAAADRRCAHGLEASDRRHRNGTFAFSCGAPESPELIPQER